MMNSKILAIEPTFLENSIKEKTAVLQNTALLNVLFSQAKQKAAAVQNGVAVINIESPIYRKSSWWLGGITHKEIKAEIQKALDNEEVKAIFYNIYSPGGSVAGTQELAAFIKEASSKKPSCAFVDGMCCSAAYWLASATGKIYATESAELGSIGVVLLHRDYSKMYEDWGIKYTYITAGSKKSVGASEIPLSEEDKEYLQNQVNGIYDVFLENISQNMGLDLNKKTEWADGRVFLGKDTVNLGLVSKIVKTKEEAMTLLLEETKENIMSIPNTQANDQEKQTVSAMSEDLYAIIEAVCGEENAQKVKNLCAANITKEQVQALGSVFLAKAENKEQDKKQELLAAITAASPQAVNNAANLKAADLSTEEQAVISRIGNLKTKE